MEEFIHDFTGFHGVPSKCHIRILNDKDKKLVIMCSQVYEKPGTSVTNMAEHIAIDIKKYLEQDNFTLATVIARYLREKKLYEMLDDLIAGLKSSKKYSIFALESIKLALEHTEKYRETKNRTNDFIWVEHYSAGRFSLLPEGDYSVVVFDRNTWQPQWHHMPIHKVVEYTGYGAKCFESPLVALKPA